MPVDEEPPVLLTATDVPRLLEELPVGARAGKPVTCRGTVRSRRRTAAHTFVMLSLEDGAGAHWLAVSFLDRFLLVWLLFFRLFLPFVNIHQFVNNVNHHH